MELLRMKPLRYLLSLCLWNSFMPLQAADETTLPKELIVKFAVGSEGRQTTLQAMQAGTAAEAHLQPLAQSLSEQINIPLTITRATSGQEVILAVDRDALMAELMERLQQRSDIEYVQPNWIMQPLGGGVSQ